MRRIIPSSALVAVFFVLLVVQPAAACHFNLGVMCNGPENQPFNPNVTVTLSDNRTAAHADTTIVATQNAHEQFVVKIVADLPKEAGADLDKPAFNEKIADVSLRASLNGVQTDLTGRIRDHNDPGHGHPAGGIYHWELEIDPSAPGQAPTFVDLFADKNSADGHMRFVFNAPQSLIDQAEMLDASVTRLETKFFANVAAGPWLTNPAVGGTYQMKFFFKARDANNNGQSAEVNKTVNVTIAERVPTTVTITPANATKRVGESHTTTVNVKDQQGSVIVGASVTWDVQSGPHAGTKCSNVPTDSAGNASCTYTEIQIGSTDTLRATATNGGQSKSVTAAVKWLAPTTVTLTPASSVKRVGESLTLTATVKDQDGAAMQGIALTFTRTGANPGSEAKTTDAAGQATHSYSGAAGNDTITATATLSGQVVSASASATWYVPQPTTLALAPSSASKVKGSSHTVTATLTDQQGQAMSGVTVHFEVTGANPTSGDGTTGANGQTTFTYTGAITGSDTITASVAGSQASATASVTWTEQQQCAFDDFDCDGLTNNQDNCWNIANPAQTDTDHDGFGDACDNDDDNDNLTDSTEASYGCNPLVYDTDADGLRDFDEYGYKTNCTNPDTDGDGLTDGAEVWTYGTNPKKADTDSDGIKDGADNCPKMYNPDQKDTDHDGKGNVCDTSPFG